MNHTVRNADVAGIAGQTTRRIKFTLVACIAAASLLVTSAFGQANFPGRPVKMIVPFAAGGATDMIVREMAKGLQELWGQPVIAENRAGAGGIIAVETTARAAPDGLTLLLASDSQFTVIPFLQDKLAYNPLTDLKGVTLVGAVPMILVANPALKVKTLGEFVTLAKSGGRTIDYASSGLGASHHMSMELLQRSAGIKLIHIPYKGGAPALQDVLAGHIPVMWSAVSTALPHIQAGKLVPLAVGSLERSNLLPNVPTVAEQGYAGFETGSWIGIFVPAGMAVALAQKIERDVQSVVRSSAYRDKLTSSGSEVRVSSSDELAARIRTEYARNRAILATMDIKKN